MSDHKTVFFNKITDSSPNLTPSEKTIAEHLTRTYPNCMLKNASELAIETNVNISTITRFFQKIGYKSIKTVQKEFKYELDSQVSTAFSELEQEDQNNSKESLKGAYIINDIKNIEATINKVSTEKLDILTGMLSHRTNQISIYSDCSFAYAIAYYSYVQLRQVRPNVILLGTDPLSVADNLSTTEANDILILFNFRNYSKFEVKLTNIFKQQGGRVINFTDSIISPIAKIADLNFEIMTRTQGDSDSYSAALTLLNFLTDALAQNWKDYMKNNSKKLEQFRKELD